jgi:hypothetical protein
VMSPCKTDLISWLLSATGSGCSGGVAGVDTSLGTLSPLLGFSSLTLKSAMTAVAA